MSKTIKIFLLGFLLCAGAYIYASVIDVSGTWEMTSQSPRGDEMVSDVKFEQDGEKITVTMSGFRGEEMTGEGTVTDSKIEWTVSISTQRGDFSITYTGKVEGDTMSGEAELGDFGTMEWTAKKK